MKRVNIALVTVCFFSSLLSCSKSVTEPEIEPVTKDEGGVITDLAFRKYCYDNFDSNGDGILSIEETGQVRDIIIDFNAGIVSVQGVEIFSNLTTFSANQCYNLREANLYNNSILKYIAFANCTGLISVTLPDSIKHIGDLCFYNCPGLTAINLPNKIDSIGNEAFALCLGLSTIVIPSSVKLIGESSFKNCQNLTHISFSEGLTAIGKLAFSDCTSLSSITLPSTVARIGDMFCFSCTNLRLFYIKAKTPPAIDGYSPFLGCSHLGTITVPSESVDKYKAMNTANKWRFYSSIIVGSTSF